MSATLIGTGGNGNVDDLSDVTLEHFYATPTHIGPFDVSTLSWHVQGVKSPVRILLDVSQVAPSGQAIVQPPATTTYMLTAAVGNARKTLGQATVAVDRSSCNEVELGNVLTLLRQQIILAINARAPENYWSGDLNDPNILSVTLSHDTPARIQIRAVFRQRIPYVPDPWVTLEISFGLGIKDGQFAAVAPQSHGDVSFDALTTSIGGFILALALAINNENEKATAAGSAMIDGLITYLNAVELHPDSGKKARFAIAEYRDGKPFIGFIQCALSQRGATIILADIVHAVSSEL